MKIIEATAAMALQVLEPGERLLWSGRPDPLRMARSRAGHALFGAAFLVLLTMTPVYGMLGAFQDIRSIGAALAPRHLIFYPVLLAAAYSIIMPGIAYRRALGTTYAVTDRRLLTMRGRKIVNFVWSDLVEAPFVGEQGEGWGDVIVPRKVANARQVGQDYDFQFPGVRGAKELRRIIAEQVIERSKRAEADPDHYLDQLCFGKQPLSADLLKELN